MGVWAVTALFFGDFTIALILIAFLVIGYMQSKVDAENEEKFKRAYEPFSKIDERIKQLETELIEIDKRQK